MSEIWEKATYEIKPLSINEETHTLAEDDFDKVENLIKNGFPSKVDANPKQSKRHIRIFLESLNGQTSSAHGKVLKDHNYYI